MAGELLAGWIIDSEQCRHSMSFTQLGGRGLLNLQNRSITGKECGHSWIGRFPRRHSDLRSKTGRATICFEGRLCRDSEPSVQICRKVHVGSQPIHTANNKRTELSSTIAIPQDSVMVFFAFLNRLHHSLDNNPPLNLVNSLL